MHLRAFTPALAALLLLANATLHAQDAAARPPAGPMTLEQCIRLGLLNNVQVRSSERTVERAGTYKKAAFGQFLPSVEGTAAWQRSDQDQAYFRNNSAVISRSSYSYNLQAGLTIFDGMRNIWGADQSILDVKASQEGHRRKREEMVAAFIANFLNVHRLRQFVRIDTSNLERSRRQLDRVVTMNKVGSVPQADVYRQQVVTSNDELTLLRAENDYKNALLEYQALLGLEPRPDFELDPGNLRDEVTDDAIRAFRQTIGTPEEMIARAAAQRADRRAADLSLQSAEKGAQIAFGAYLPTLSGFATYGWSNYTIGDFSLYDRFTYGLNLSVPLFTGFRTQTGVERADLDVLAAQDNLRQVEREIVAGVRKALNNLDAAEKNIEIANKKLVSAREDQRTATERYDLGAGTLLDVIVANSGLTTAEGDLINAAFAYLIARRQVEYELGILQF